MSLIQLNQGGTVHVGTMFTICQEVLAGDQPCSIKSYSIKATFFVSTEEQLVHLPKHPTH